MRCGTTDTVTGPRVISVGGAMCSPWWCCERTRTPAGRAHGGCAMQCDLLLADRAGRLETVGAALGVLRLPRLGVGAERDVRGHHVAHAVCDRHVLRRDRAAVELLHHQPRPRRATGRLEHGPGLKRLERGERDTELQQVREL